METCSSGTRRQWLIGALVCAASPWAVAQADGNAPYRSGAERRLAMPEAEAQRYARLAEGALAAAAFNLRAGQPVLVVDRHPFVQALIVIRRAEGGWVAAGAWPVSTGHSGTFDDFPTPLGVFTLQAAPLRSTGETVDGVRPLGESGLGVWDFGDAWMHSMDIDGQESRLGLAQTRGEILIPASLNRWLDTQALRPGTPLVVLQTERADRPAWSPAPVVPRVRRGRVVALGRPGPDQGSRTAAPSIAPWRTARSAAGASASA
jgi:hypothetical protein